MKGFQLKFLPFNERSILVEWPSRIDEDVLKDVLLFKNIIQKNLSKVVVEIIQSYNSLLVIYDSTIDDFNGEILKLKSLSESQVDDVNLESLVWEIPVCYDTKFGLDLNEISEEKKLTKQELIQLHSQPFYTVYFIGFLPGFLYLGGLDHQLQFPRKSKPRMKVEKGALAIGGHQTGIYPNESPGGWNIIGNSPLEFFNPQQSPPCFVKAGDQVQFVPIDILEYEKIKRDLDRGVYQPKFRKRL